MLSCKQSARLISEGQDRPLSLSERAALRFHLFICGNCRNFNKQIDFMHQACRRFFGGKEPGES